MTTMRLLVIGALLLLSGAVSCNLIDARPEAEALAEQSFSARASGDRDRLLSLYGEAFYEATSRSQWSQMLDSLERKLGVPEEHSLKQWKVTVGSQGAGSGTYVTLSYAVDYSKSSGEETLVIFRPAGGEELKIIGHQVNSAALLVD